MLGIRFPRHKHVPKTQQVGRRPTTRFPGEGRAKQIAYLLASLVPDRGSPARPRRCSSLDGTVENRVHYVRDTPRWQLP